MHFVQSAGRDYKAASAICSLVTIWSHLAWPSHSHFHHHPLSPPPTFYNIGDGSTTRIGCHRLCPLPHHHPNDANGERQTQDSKWGTVPYMAWALGNGKLPHDPITIETTHPHHHSSTPNDANKDPCTQIGEQGRWEIVGCQRTRDGQRLWALSNWWVCPWHACPFPLCWHAACLPHTMVHPEQQTSESPYHVCGRGARTLETCQTANNHPRPPTNEEDACPNDDKGPEMNTNDASTHKQTQVTRSQGEQLTSPHSHLSYRIQVPRRWQWHGNQMMNDGWNPTFIVVYLWMFVSIPTPPSQSTSLRHRQQWNDSATTHCLSFANTQISECPTTLCHHPPTSLTPRLQTSNHCASRMANKRPRCPCHVHGASETPLTECPPSLLPSLPLC